MSKNKLKIRNSVRKRFKVTKTGKVLRRSSHLRHLRRKESKRVTRRKKVLKPMTGKMAIKIKKMLGKA
ncbi:50S ribosomal protein L35 [Patescibacteria group bacterium]|nr:50S ribosomal protein L35 [Patescibacteria group bacterium]MBU1931347.1 50S ribosomal protein L35 [Patescibacteria group bacterium]